MVYNKYVHVIKKKSISDCHETSVRVYACMSDLQVV